MSDLYKEYTLYSSESWGALVSFVKANAVGAAKDGKPLRVVVTASDRQRSSDQNRRYWGAVLAAISSQAWVGGRQYNKDAWHELLARKFGICEDVELPGGEVIQRRKSTTDMTVAQFSDYMHEVESYAASELGVIF